MFSKLSYFINQRGIGLKLIIPLSFLVALLLSLQVIKPFQESLNQPQMQSLLELVAKPQIDKDAIKKNLNIQTLDENNYILGLMAEVLFKLHEKGVVSHFSPEQLNDLLSKAFYLQGLFLSFILTLISVLAFLFLYVILKNIGPLFNDHLQKNAWGRILSLVWGCILICYATAIQFQLNFNLIYLCIIALLASLVIARQIKKHS